VASTGSNWARGAQSTLYGLEAMTSLCRSSTREGTTRVPELALLGRRRTFATARGYASLAWLARPFDYDAFGGETTSQAKASTMLFCSSEGANVGVALSDHVSSACARGTPAALTVFRANGSATFSRDSARRRSARSHQYFPRQCRFEHRWIFRWHHDLHATNTTCSGATSTA